MLRAAGKTEEKMANDLQIPDQFAETLEKLDRLSRNHLLHFRLEVGKLLLEQFFGGEAAAYQSNDPTKPQSFNEFTAACAEHLADIGLGDQVLRHCINAHIVVKALPPPTAAKLAFTQVVELTRVPDVATRNLLAQAAVDNHWTTRELKGAVEAQKAGKWIDGDKKTPGLQPTVPSPYPPGPKGKQQPQYDASHPPQAGRVVAKFEWVLKEFEAVVGEWALVDPRKVSELQRQRVLKAVAGMGVGVVVVER